MLKKLKQKPLLISAIGWILALAAMITSAVLGLSNKIDIANINTGAIKVGLYDATPVTEDASLKIQNTLNAGGIVVVVLAIISVFCLLTSIISSTGNKQILIANIVVLCSVLIVAILPLTALVDENSGTWILGDPQENDPLNLTYKVGGIIAIAASSLLIVGSTCTAGFVAYKTIGKK